MSKFSKPLDLTYTGVKTFREECFRRFYDNGRQLRVRKATNFQKRGDLAGTPSGTDRNVKVLGTMCKVVRILWLMRTGEWPKGRIQHINGKLSDHWKENLRDVPQIKINRGRRGDLNVTSAYKGVCMGYKRWRAQIKVNGVVENLGQYESEERAAVAYDQRARDAWGKDAYLNFPNLYFK